MTAPAADAVYSFRHGAFDITVLSDGYLSIPAEIVVADAPPAQRDDIRMRLSPHAGLVDVKMNIPLVRTGSDIIIFDEAVPTRQREREMPRGMAGGIKCLHARDHVVTRPQQDEPILRPIALLN